MNNNTAVMSCHCDECKGNIRRFYGKFFGPSDLFPDLQDFTKKNLSHNRRKVLWSRALEIATRGLKAAEDSLKRDCILNIFLPDGETLSSSEFSDWILSYICDDCWESQPLPHSTLFYFFSPVVTDLYYSLVCSLDFVEKEPYLKKNCLNFLVSMKKKYVCRNGLMCYNFRGFNYYYEKIAGFPIYLHGLTTRENYEIRKKGRLNMEIEDHPLASHGLLWKQLLEMFDEDGAYITNY